MKEAKTGTHLSRREFDDLKRTLNDRGEMTFRLHGGSMRPLLSGGELIRVKPLTERPSRFELIVFLNDNRLFGHYVWHHNHLAGPGRPETIVTRGLSAGEDLPVPLSDVLGRIENFKIGFFTRTRIFLKAWWKR